MWFHPGRPGRLDANPYCHMLTNTVKTTLDLPDDLLIEAKAVAARRRTTLKEMFTRALRHEIGLDQRSAPLPADGPFVVGDLGLPVLKKRGRMIDSKDVRRMLQELEEEDFQKSIRASARP